MAKRCWASGAFLFCGTYFSGFHLRFIVLFLHACAHDPAYDTSQESLCPAFPAPDMLAIRCPRTGPDTTVDFRFYQAYLRWYQQFLDQQALQRGVLP